MKINGVAGTDTVVNTNNREQVEKKEDAQQGQQGKAKVKNGTVKGSELNLAQDSVAEKKKKAMEDAMRFIKDQYKSDQMVDDVLQECRDSIKTSKESAEEAHTALQEIEKQKEELGELYADKEDEEYKTRLSELDKEASHWRKQYEDAHDVITAATKGIKAVKLEVLKHHGMIDAGKAAEKTLKAASDEIIGMLKQEAVDKIDEDLEDVVEEAKEKKEEEVKQDVERQAARAEQEKKAQEVKEQIEEIKKRAAESKAVPDSMVVQELLDAHQEVVRNTQQILEEQKLLEEEIKGIIVDSQL